ncbi:MAG: LytTR family transcriptional regulator, partial [Oscillospiraceae bacterium]|nr:LytTR family transcriptional regulator [Oscillospiraceae bacterium]
RLILHTQSGDYTTGETMNAMEKMLAPHNFYRCNNCYLINFAHVERVKQNLVVVAGNELQISRPKRKGFMEALAGYIGGVAR